MTPRDVFVFVFRAILDGWTWAQEYPADAAAIGGFLLLWGSAAFVAATFDPKPGARVR